MTLSVFISHSVGPAENPTVNHLSASLAGAGVPNYVAMHDRQPGVRLSEKVKRHIESSRVLIAMLTKRGNEASWVRDEIGYALGKGLRVVAFVERDLKLDGMHEGAEYVSFDPTDPSRDISVLSERLAREKAEEEAALAKAQTAEAQLRAEQAEFAALIIFVLALIAIAYFASRK